MSCVIANTKTRTARPSILDSFPGEIRESIYNEYLFNGRDRCCVFQPSWDEAASGDIASKSKFPSCSVAYPVRANVVALPLILTCRQIYAEATRLLYAKARFYFTDLAVLDIFLRQLSNHHLHLIRSLHLEWTSFVWFDIGCSAVRGAYLRQYWEPVCDVLSNMRSLRDLRIRIQPAKRPTRGKGFCEMEYLEPLRTIKAENFVLEL